MRAGRWTTDDKTLRQPVAELLGEAGHLGEVGRAAMIEPVPELASAEGFGADLGERCRELGAIQPDQVDAPVCARTGRRETAGVTLCAHMGNIGPVRPPC